MLIISTILLYFTVNQCIDGKPCGDDWTMYGQYRCLKLFTQIPLLSYDSAETFCQEQSINSNNNSHDSQSSGSLVEIKFPIDQLAIVSMLRSYTNLSDDIWLGGKFQPDTNKYQWISDNSPVGYTNWQQGSPKNLPDHCIGMSVEPTVYGQWSDVRCQKKSMVMCQKIQSWSMADMQHRLMTIETNPVPLGFIYVQLPNQQPPSEIWPWIAWQDISPEYAGLFFRTLGSGSEPFGKVQSDNSPRLDSISSQHSYQIAWGSMPIAADGQWSKHIYTGDSYGKSESSLAFHTTGGEVRPRNVAIKIWKRYV
ncbi:uncharacterized protein LOC128957266 [Oppia nitens]|uniref:uncharacterized protein LOC128957266 n=1 Tax=Oppia nitens TaxID=1686743 RepID=UPI0023DC6682|nr:uncharacterized protein LOC128957266 [Oppia nitens]